MHQEAAGSQPKNKLATFKRLPCLDIHTKMPRYMPGVGTWVPCSTQQAFPMHLLGQVKMCIAIVPLL